MLLKLTAQKWTTGNGSKAAQTQGLGRLTLCSSPMPKKSHLDLTHPWYVHAPKVRAKCNYVHVGRLVRVKCWSVSGFCIPQKLKLSQYIVGQAGCPSWTSMQKFSSLTSLFSWGRSSSACPSLFQWVPKHRSRLLDVSFALCFALVV